MQLLSYIRGRFVDCPFLLVLFADRQLFILFRVTPGVVVQQGILFSGHIDRDHATTFILIVYILSVVFLSQLVPLSERYVSV